jgi:spore coat polysaccharide biosynthesis protein SpsF
MKIGFVILCRFNSSRLPGKILREISGKPILKYIYESLSVIVKKENIAVATSEEKTDDPIAEFCKENDINLFRGDLDNVSKRFLDCAESFGFEYATRINGDNIFIDLETIQQMLNITKTNQYDFVSNVKNRTFPKGMSVEIVRTSHYKNKYKDFNKQDDFEHVTLNLYQNELGEHYYYYFNTKCQNAAGLQFAVDTIDDFILAEKIILDLKKTNNFTLDEVYNSYMKLIKNG